MALHEIHWNPSARAMVLVRNHEMGPDAEWVGPEGAIPVCEVVKSSYDEGPSIDAIGPIGAAAMAAMAARMFVAWMAGLADDDHEPGEAS